MAFTDVRGLGLPGAEPPDGPGGDAASGGTFQAERCGRFKEVLLGWWRRSGGAEAYPWRGDRDPYRTLVAEILLVRTRREAVLRVYGEFLRRFPDPCALGGADPKQVEEAIRPLGLVRRAGYLKRLGEVLCGAGFSPELLEGIDGVGPYVRTLTLAKLGLSREVALDGNGARLLHRLAAGRDPAAARRAERDPSVLAFKQRCLDGDPEALELTYALIDAGARICTARPRCGACPLRSLCRYRLPK